MEVNEVLTIETEKVICNDVTILKIARDSVMVKSLDGRVMEIDLDAITGIS